MQSPQPRLNQFYLTEVLGIRSIVRPPDWEISDELRILGSKLSDFMVVNLTQRADDLCFASHNVRTQAGELLAKMLQSIGRDWNSIYFIEKLITHNDERLDIWARLTDMPSLVVLSLGGVVGNEVNKSHQFFFWQQKQCLVTHSLSELLNKTECKRQAWEDLKAVKAKLK